MISSMWKLTLGCVNLKFVFWIINNFKEHCIFFHHLVPTKLTFWPTFLPLQIFYNILTLNFSNLPKTFKCTSSIKKNSPLFIPRFWQHLTKKRNTIGQIYTIKRFQMFFNFFVWKMENFIIKIGCHDCLYQQPYIS